MNIFIVILHVVVCIALIMIVLLQTGKGADMGAAFGGGSSQTLFGSGGGVTFMGKLTTAAAVIFMLTSLTLAYMSGKPTGGSVMEGVAPPVEQPLELPAAGQPEAAPAPAAEAAPSEAAPAPEAPAAGE